jgi:hypothetical protein
MPSKDAGEKLLAKNPQLIKKRENNWENRSNLKDFLYLLSNLFCFFCPLAPAIFVSAAPFFTSSSAFFLALSKKDKLITS